MNVAGRLAERVGLPKDQAALVRQTALLHDIGHGPFSHVSENLLDHYSRSDHTHERVSAWIVESDQEILDVLKGPRCRQVSSLLKKEGLRSVIRDIVSSRADADKLDYLLRDSYACGVKYGIFDAERLIETAVSLAGAEPQLGFDKDSVWALEGLILARHHMHRQVYGHRTRLVTDAMLVRSMELAVEAGVLNSAAFTFKRTKRFLKEFLALDDRETERRIIRGGGKAREIMLRLRERRLLKRVYQEELEQLYRRGEFNWDMINYLIDRNRFTKSEVRRVEKYVADELRVPAHEVVLSLETQENPTYRTPGYETTEHDIMLYDRTINRTVPFFQESDIFQGAVKSMRRFLSLYLPTDGLSAGQRKGLERRSKRVVTDALSEMAP